MKKKRTSTGNPYDVRATLKTNFSRGNTGLCTDRPILLLVGTRRGKGRSSFIPELLSGPNSVWTVDDMGTLATVRAHLGQGVYTVDPLNALDKAAGFDPMAIDFNTADSHKRVIVSADALVVPDPDQKAQYFNDGARTILGGSPVREASSPGASAFSKSGRYKRRAKGGPQS